MIVRDGGDSFIRCLESIRAHVDEIIVVDTGSKDGSIEAAKAAGATVFNFEWIDDFSAARNAALEHVTTDWFLSIDADDELVCVRTREELSKLFDVAPRVLIDYVDVVQGGAVKVPRFFKVMPGARWHQPIHEGFVQPGVRTQVSIDAKEGVCIKHHGYHPGVNDQKIERNLRILRGHLAKEPDNAGSLFYLARECAWSGQFEEGLAAGERLLETAELEGILLADALAVTMWCAVSHGRLDRVIELGRDARRFDVPNVWTEYLLALALVNSGNRPKALEAAERACSLPQPEESMLALTEVWMKKRFELRNGIRSLMTR